MSAIANGLAASGLRPYVATFFNFLDYAKPSVRLSALSRLPGDLGLHPRLRRARRGRPDPPADRAARNAARDARRVRLPPGRRQRDDRRVAGRARPRPADGAHPDPPGARRARSRALSRRRCGAGRLRARGRSGSRRHPDRHGLRGARGARSARAPERDRGVSSRVVSLPSWELFEEQPESYRAEVLPPEIEARVSVEAAATPGLGALRGAARGRSSASTASARRRRERRCSRIWASPPERVADEAERVLQAASIPSGGQRGDSES